MKRLAILSLLVVAAGGVALARAPAPDAAPADPDAARYDAEGRMLPPVNYREWVFLSSGLNMSYNPRADAAGMDMFGNTFAPRAAYAAFQKTGRWPEGTVLMLENRVGATKGSINQHGQFQTAELMGMEAHVKDSARYQGGWAFFAFDGDKPARQIPQTAACYACHQAHAAADTTFVQFYPTLLPTAARLKTLGAGYLADEAAAKP
jgi:hypothetical protein